MRRITGEVPRRWILREASFKNHRVKLQLDYTHITDAPVATTVGNWFQNNEIDMIRMAFQVAF